MPVPVDLQISFDTGPNDEPVWQSVGADLVSWQIKRGQSGGRWATGTLRATLNNLNRQYEQFYSGSANFPNVIPRKQIRALAGGVVRFTGKIERWQTFYPSRNMSQVLITAADALKDLAGLELDVPYVVEVLEDLDLVDSPQKAYYRFSERTPDPLPTGTQPLLYGLAADFSGAGNHGSIETFDAARLLMAQPDGLTDEIDGAFTFTPGAGGQTSYVLAPAGVFGQGRPARFHIGCRLKTVVLAGGVIVFIDKQTAGAPYALDITAGGKASWRWAPAMTLTSLSTVTDGNWHQVDLTYDGAICYLVIDGLVEAQQASVQPATNSALYRWYIGGLPIGYGPSFTGTLDEVVMVPEFVTPARLKARHAARNGLLGQWSDERIAWLADRAGLSSAARTLALGRTKLQSAPNLAGQSALSHAQLIEQTEAGQLFVRANGSLEFVNRYGPFGDRASSSTSQLTLVDAWTGVGTEYTTASLETTDDDIASQVSVSRRGGITAVARSLASMVKWGSLGYRRRGAAAQQLSSESNSDLDAQDQADWWQAILEEPARLVAGLEVARSNEVLEVLVLELFDRATFALQPPGGGAEIRFEALTTGITDVCRAVDNSYTVTLDASAELLLIQPLWIWGTSAWDQTTRWGWEQQPSRSATAWRWGTGAWDQSTQWA